MRKGMFTFFGGLVLSALLSFGAMAQQAEIEETINSQFDAFRADDFAAALEFATPNLQRFFQTPENFRSMVSNGYPMVQNPAEVRFLDRRADGSRFYQVVQVVDPKVHPFAGLSDGADGRRLAHRRGADPRRAGGQRLSAVARCPHGGPSGD